MGREKPGRNAPRCGCFRSSPRGQELWGGCGIREGPKDPWLQIPGLGEKRRREQDTVLGGDTGHRSQREGHRGRARAVLTRVMEERRFLNKELKEERGGNQACMDE